MPVGLGATPRGRPGWGPSAAEGFPPAASTQIDRPLTRKREGAAAALPLSSIRTFRIAQIRGYGHRGLRALWYEPRLGGAGLPALWDGHSAGARGVIGRGHG